MNRSGRTMVSVALSIAMVLQQTILHAAVPGGAPGDPAPATLDVALSPNGGLLGQVVSAQGVGLSGIEVVAYQDSREVARTRADAQGLFVLAGLQPGVYVLHGAATVRVVRLWPRQAAPPSAQAGALIVSQQQQAVRGQGPGFLRPLLVWTAIVGSVAGAYSLGFNAGLDRSPKSR